VSLISSTRADSWEASPSLFRAVFTPSLTFFCFFFLFVDFLFFFWFFCIVDHDFFVAVPPHSTFSPRAGKPLRPPGSEEGKVALSCGFGWVAVCPLFVKVLVFCPF